MKPAQLSSVHVVRRKPPRHSGGRIRFDRAHFVAVFVCRIGVRPIQHDSTNRKQRGVRGGAALHSSRRQRRRRSERRQ